MAIGLWRVSLFCCWFVCQRGSFVFKSEGSFSSCVDLEINYFCCVKIIVGCRTRGRGGWMFDNITSSSSSGSGSVTRWRERSCVTSFHKPPKQKPSLRAFLPGTV